jgi:chromosome segregation ATPase
MPGLVQRGQKRRSLAISDEDEQSDHSAVSVGSKRARHARDASGSPFPTNGRVRTQHPSPHGTSTYVEDEFQPGSLIRVKLKNFVTYTAAEFHLGPSLNMVIGPNGTGKSTLVCAICLGLGWGSEHLGRAKELGAFVKHGATEAVIEIELAAGPRMDKNPVVQRTIRKSDNKSVFDLNGKRVAQNVVTTMCKSLSIQIDNLCQFLPQDRVVEFAKMTDVDRLRETQRAAAPAHMVEWHDMLKVLRSEEKGLETRQGNEQSHLEKLEKQQNATRDDVERWHQRQDLVKKSRCLKKVKPIIELHLRKVEVAQAKEDLRAAKRELDQIRAEVDPVRQAQAEAQTYQDQIQQVVNLRRNRSDMIKTQADKLMTKINHAKQSVSDFVDEIQGEVHSKKTRERDIVRIKADITRLERQRQENPVEYDAGTYDARKAELRSQMSAAQNQLTEQTDKHNGLSNQAHDLNTRHRTALAQREALDTQGGKQEGLLARYSRDTAQAWAWIRENRANLPFQGDVFGPPLLECSVSDPKYAQALESVMRKGDVVAITCTNSEDSKLLSDRLLGKKENGGLGLHDIHLRTTASSLDSYRPPVGREELPNLGFEGYLLDYIKGPETVVAMLCDNARLHSVAFAAQAISELQHNAVEHSAIRKWISGKEIYAIATRREYNASSTSVTQIKKAQFFVDQPVNTEEKRHLDEKIKECEQQGLELKELVASSKQVKRKLEQDISDLKQARVIANNRKYMIVTKE